MKLTTIFATLLTIIAMGLIGMSQTTPAPCAAKFSDLLTDAQKADMQVLNLDFDTQMAGDLLAYHNTAVDRQVKKILASVADLDPKAQAQIAAQAQALIDAAKAAQAAQPVQ